jgi:ferritin
VPPHRKQRNAIFFQDLWSRKASSQDGQGTIASAERRILGKKPLSMHNSGQKITKGTLPVKIKIGKVVLQSLFLDKRDFPCEKNFRGYDGRNFVPTTYYNNPQAIKEIAMLTPRMLDALNEQMKWELFSGYLYLSMSSYFSDLGLPGFSHWMRMQAQEELTHGMKFYDYILERGGRAILASIDKPDETWDSPLACFEHTLEHEQLVTSRINDLANIAIEEKDHAAGIFLQWFVTEQVEEEDSVGEVLSKLKLIGKDGSGMFMMDKELSERLAPASSADV